MLPKTHPSPQPGKPRGTTSIVEHTAIVPLNSEGCPSELALAVQVRDAEKLRAAEQLLKKWELSPRDLLVFKDQKLGSGGQADVFAGRWQGLPVAIKMLRTDRQASAAAQRSIEHTVRREVRALARVRHSNVIPLHGACMEPTPCIVMARAEGGSLETALRDGRFSSVPDAVKLLAGIARGMAAVHAHQVLQPTPWSP